MIDVKTLRKKIYAYFTLILENKKYKRLFNEYRDGICCLWLRRKIVLKQKR